MKSRAKNIFWGICFLAVGISILGDWFAWWDGFSFSELLFAASMAFCILEDAKVFQMIFSGAAIIIGLCLIFGKKTKPGLQRAECGIAAAGERIYGLLFGRTCEFTGYGAEKRL